MDRVTKGLEEYRLWEYLKKTENSHRVAPNKMVLFDTEGMTPENYKVGPPPVFGQQPPHQHSSAPCVPAAELRA
jgi:hypothetical protein